MDNCIFCKIIAGEISCQKIAENKEFLAFLSNAPFTQGHTLIIPKTHYRWSYDVPNFGDYWEFTKIVTQKIQNKLNPEFITYLTMGNEVQHSHIHIMPRYKDDNITKMFTDQYEMHPSNEQLQQIADNINS